MSRKKGKASSARKKSSKPPYQMILGVAAVIAVVAIYFYSGRDTSSTAVQQAQGSLAASSEYLAEHPHLRNRLILPAIPHQTRPVTLPPESFTGEIRQAYQAARDYPEVLETVSCYCGCYGDGHRNNLDCYKDNHGIT